MLWMEKNKGLIFVMFHVLFVYPGSWKLKHFIFVKFCVPGVMKFGENWSIWFLCSFVYSGSWNLEKIEAFDFCEVSCTWGHENWRKFKHLIFCEVSCTRVHENFRKLKHFIYVKFCVPEVMKIGENWIIWILLILCTRGYENWRKLKHLIFFCVHKTSKKSNPSMFSDFHDRIHETSQKFKCFNFLQL